MSDSNDPKDGAGKKASKKLKLNKTTLRKLSGENLKGVAGGVDTVVPCIVDPGGLPDTSGLTGGDCYSGLVPCDAYSRQNCTHAAPFCN